MEDFGAYNENGDGLVFDVRRHVGKMRALGNTNHDNTNNISNIPIPSPIGSGLFSRCFLPICILTLCALSLW